MKKRSSEKIAKRSIDKVKAGERLTKIERSAFNKHMKNWLGPEIVGRIKKFARVEF